MNLRWAFSLLSFVNQVPAGSCPQTLQRSVWFKVLWSVMGHSWFS